MKFPILSICLASLFLSCSVRPAAFLPDAVPPPPDYSKSEYWAALPDKTDPADQTPAATFENLQAEAQVDVFFLHPTIYWQKTAKPWNASAEDQKLNEKVDKTTILFQASAFNGSGKVYAPRYRQAHLRSFFTEDKASADQALEVAYQDLKRAFEYYLEHYNQGRPFIIASHSQGARHGYRLLREMFDGKPLQRKLVAAYLVGWPIPESGFDNIPPCETPDQTGCICSWRSYRFGYVPKNATLGDSIIVTNPLTWTTEKTPASKTLNEGTILRNFNKVYPQITDAQIHNGILWVHKPRFPGSIFFTRKNYHIADYNLFYVNLRKNAMRRVDAFWK